MMVAIKSSNGKFSFTEAGKESMHVQSLESRNPTPPVSLPPVSRPSCDDVREL